MILITIRNLMKNKIIFLTLTLTLLSSHVMAEYSMKYPLEELANVAVEPALENGTPITTPWTNVGSPSNCSSYSPELTDFFIGDKFRQDYVGCSQIQERTVTPTLVNPKTGVTTNGTPHQETQTLSNYSYTLIQVGTGTKVCGKQLAYHGSGAVWTEMAINIDDSPNMGYHLYWDGYTIKDQRYVQQTRISSTVVNGYTYTRGAYITLQSQGNGYQAYKYDMCKEIIK